MTDGSVVKKVHLSRNQRERTSGVSSRRLVAGREGRCSAPCEKTHDVRLGLDPLEKLLVKAHAGLVECLRLWVHRLCLPFSAAYRRPPMPLARQWESRWIRTTSFCELYTAGGNRTLAKVPYGQR